MSEMRGTIPSIADMQKIGLGEMLRLYFRIGMDFWKMVWENYFDRIGCVRFVENCGVYLMMKKKAEIEFKLYSKKKR